MNIDNVMEQISSLIINYGNKLIWAILILLIGMRIIKFIKSFTKRFLAKQKIDNTLRTFLNSSVGVTFHIILLITVLGTIGMEMSSFIALLGAAGLAIGLSLSGTLQNFAGGIILLVFKPFRVKDLVEVGEFIGHVTAIEIFHTKLITLDNKTVILPNGSLSNSNLINYTDEDQLRIEWTFGIAYGDDVDKARKILNRIAATDKRILKTPKFLVVIGELANSSVNFTVRAWVKNNDYWGVFFDMNEKVYNEFNKQGVNIPFPQMDVHLHQSKKALKE